MMHNDLPHWKTCYHYFRLWVKLGYWDTGNKSITRSATWLALSFGKKPRPLRLSIVKAFKQLASPEFVAMIRVRRSREESDLFW